MVKYFMEKKKLNFLLKNTFLKRADLSKCFDNYPSLSWIKDIKNEHFASAATTLSTLGGEEKQSFMKKRSLTSMSKLNLIAASGMTPLTSKEKNLLANLNRQLEYLSYFENLPPNTLKVKCFCSQINVWN